MVCYTLWKKHINYSFRFPFQKIDYCMEEREVFRFFQIYFSNAAFSVLLAHILFIFGSGNLKTKPKPNHIHPLLSSWFRCLKFPRVCLYKSLICLASFWYTCRLHFVFFLLILLIYLTSWERKHGHSFLYGTSFFHPVHPLSCFGFLDLFSLVEWALLSRHAGALV